MDIHFEKLVIKRVSVDKFTVISNDARWLVSWTILSFFKRKNKNEKKDAVRI
jgi:hypothetical protein